MKDFKEVIVIFDSGIGGLAYFEYIQKSLKNNNYVYVADNKNFPYGEKSSKYLLKIILSLVAKLQDIFKIKALVFACNTASVSLFNKLNLYLPVIYTLPEVSLISELALKKVFLIATNTAIKSKFVKNQKKLHKDLMIKAAPELVNFVELQDKYKREAFVYLKNLKVELQDTNREIIFLGCTHYLHIKELITNFLELPVYENRELVVQKLIELVGSPKDGSYQNKYYYSSEFYLTKNENLFFYKDFCKKYDLHFKGIIS